MATGTNNPPGSTDPRDLYANAQNLDLLLTGPQPFYPDRLGVQRYSWEGMESDYTAAQSGRQIAFQQFLAGSGFEAPVSYAAGITLERATQTFVRDNVQYRIKDPADLPYTLTGNWATESDNFASMGDSGLRQDLAGTSGAGQVGFDEDLAYPELSVGASLAALVKAAAAGGDQLVSVKTYGVKLDGTTDDTAAWQDAFDDARTRKINLFVPPGDSVVSETILYDTTGLGYYAGLRLFGSGQMASRFVNKITAGGPAIRLTSGTGSGDQQQGGLISAIGCIQSGSGAGSHFIEYQGIWHHRFENLYADSLTGAALRCININGDADSSAHVNIDQCRFISCAGGAWDTTGGTGGITIHTIRDMYSVNCGATLGAAVVIDGCLHLQLLQCSITGQGDEAPNVPLVKIKATNLRSRVVRVEGGEYGNNGGTHFDIAALNTGYFGSFRQVRREGENNSTRGFKFYDGTQLYRNVHIGPIELSIDTASPAWTWCDLGSGIGGNFTIDPPNNDSFAAGNIYYAGSGANRVSRMDTSGAIEVSNFVKRVRASHGTPGTFTLDIYSGKWQQVEFTASGAYTISVPTTGVRDGQEFDLTIINSASATVSFSASMFVTGYTNSTTEKSATFRFDEASTRWKQIGGWSA